jgi:hypothetical protein
MSFIYSLAVLGLPTATQLSELENAVTDAVSMFGLRVGQEIGWEVSPDTFILINSDLLLLYFSAD